jgi:hypothetical protein
MILNDLWRDYALRRSRPTGSGWLVSGFVAGDQIDFGDIGFTGVMTSTKGKKGATGEVTFTGGANMSSTLTVTDGVHTANIALLGQYTAASFTAASDGHGGTVITVTGDTSSAALAPPYHK